MQIKQSKGFTLVELSIVIVIIGLIVAGVVAGQTLVQQAKLRQIVSDVDKFRVAYNTFKLTYNQIPGDMNNASAYWGAVPDGDGNKYIVWQTESARVWQTLALAGLIPGTYSGVGVDRDISPHAAIGGYYTLWGSASYSGTAHFGGVKAKNVLQLGTASGGAFPEFPILTVPQAQGMDTKIDDGMPFSGKMGNRTMATTDCLTGSNYNLTFVGAACAPTFFVD